MKIITATVIIMTARNTRPLFRRAMTPEELSKKLKSENQNTQMKTEIILELINSPLLPAAADKHEGSLRAGLAYLAWRADGSHIGDDKSRRLATWLEVADAIPEDRLDAAVTASQIRLDAALARASALEPARVYFAALSLGGSGWKEEWATNPPPAALAVLGDLQTAAQNSTERGAKRSRSPTGSAKWQTP